MGSTMGLNPIADMGSDVGEMGLIPMGDVGMNPIADATWGPRWA